MPSVQELNTAVVLRYFDGCNSGDLEHLLGTLDPEVVHYFSHRQFKPIRGAQHLARYWSKFKRLLDPVWKIDQIIAQGDQVASEWSCLWTPEGGDKRVMMRGSEWYLVRDGLIVEIRGYFDHNETANTELTGFAYAERGYLM